MVNSRGKGIRGENEFAQLLKQWWPQCARNIDQFRSDKRDILHTPGVHWQVKRVERLNIWLALNQAETEADKLDIPIVAFRRNRGGWYAALPLEELLPLLKLKERG